MQATQAPRPLLDSPRAAEYLGISKSMLAALVREGKVAAVKFSRRAVRFRQDDLDAFIAKHRTAAAR